MSGFVVSPQARLDLLDLWNGIAEHNIDAADRARDSILSAINKLVDMPGMGHTRGDLTDKAFALLARQSVPHYLPAQHRPAANRSHR